MIVHVSPKLQSYRETLMTVQLASRIHRMRRRRFRFLSSAPGNGSGVVQVIITKLVRNFVNRCFIIYVFR